MILRTTTALLAVAIATTAPAVDAQDASVRQNAAGMCQGTLPQFAGSLRARPLGLANEGTTPAFVTCAFPGAEGARYPGMEIIFFNRGTAAATINCTIVSGRAFGNTPRYYTRSVVVPVDNVNSIVHTAEAADLSNVVSFNCNLPATTEISYVRIDRTV